MEIKNELALILGIRGSGKTSLTKVLSLTRNRVIVLDRMRDYQTEKQIIGYNDFSREWSQIFSHSEFYCVVHFKKGQSAEVFQEESNNILRLIYETSDRQHSQGVRLDTLIVIEELQFYCTPYFITPYLKECILTGRHYGIGMIANTQRPANIHGDFKGNADHIFAGQLAFKADVQYLRDSILQDDANRCFTLPKFNFLYKTFNAPVIQIQLNQ